MKYKIFDADGREVMEQIEVLDPVSLTGVETSSGSNLVTVASTASLHPGMPVRIPNIPLGAWIHAIKSSTVIELYASVYAAGAWTTSAANANASATATGMLGRALGYDPECLIALTHARGPWRNIIRATSPMFSGTTTGTNGLPYALVPTYNVSGGSATLTALTQYLGDDLSASPTRRHTGEVWSVRPFVHTGGHITHVAALPGGAVQFAGADD